MRKIVLDALRGTGSIERHKRVISGNSYAGIEKKNRVVKIQTLFINYIIWLYFERLIIIDNVIKHLA